MCCRGVLSERVQVCSRRRTVARGGSHTQQERRAVRSAGEGSFGEHPRWPTEVQISNARDHDVSRLVRDEISAVHFLLYNTHARTPHGHLQPSIHGVLHTHATTHDTQGETDSDRHPNKIHGSTTRTAHPDPAPAAGGRACTPQGARPSAQLPRLSRPSLSSPTVATVSRGHGACTPSPYIYV